MSKNTRTYLIRVCVISGWLMLMTGCDVTTNQALPVDVSTPSTDLAMFLQQFARESLAAFLF